MPDSRCTAFAPGRVNVIGEHTDYNDGLALPFAISQGVTVRAAPTTGERVVRALATDLQEHDQFPLDDPGPASGWRSYVHGAVAELSAAGHPLVPVELRIAGNVPHGSGLSSSAALTVALCLALLGTAETPEERREPETPATAADRIWLARLCSRVENDWAGARTGLLDQLASLFGAADTVLCIDFQALEVTPVALELAGWRFAIADSGERHVHASSGYNERRSECAEACTELGVRSLREARIEDLSRLSSTLARRARHVLEENERVREAVALIRTGDLPGLGALLNSSHSSLRDLYEVSTPAVEAAVERLLRAGASGARLIGGGFGGSVLGLFAPGVELPHECIEVSPGPGAHVLPR